MIEPSLKLQKAGSVQSILVLNDVYLCKKCKGLTPSHLYNACFDLMI